MSKIAVWVYASAGLMAVGAFGPWATVLGASISGTDGSRDGWGVVAAAAGGAFAFWKLGHLRRGRALVAAIGIGSAALTFYDRTDMQHIIGGGGPLAQTFMSVGWGLNLALFASASLAAAGLVSLEQSEAREEKQEPEPVA